MPGRQLVIVLGGFGRWLGATDRLNLGVGKVFHCNRLTIPALWALIHVRRIKHDTAPPFLISPRHIKGKSRDDQTLCSLPNSAYGSQQY